MSICLKQFTLFSVIALLACNQPTDTSAAVQNHPDSINKKFEPAFKPGFGDFMSVIQAHHSKLWFAGQNQNWQVADLEVLEIGEAISNIKNYQAALKGSRHATLMQPALDSIDLAIKHKSAVRFKAGYIMLTDACNQCHREANVGFNVVKIPDAQPQQQSGF